MAIQFTVRMVGELKGPPLAVLNLLILAGRPVTFEWLCNFANYSDKPITAALRKLSSPEYQIAHRNGSGLWVLNRDFQLPLGFSELVDPENTYTTQVRKNSERVAFTYLLKSEESEEDRVSKLSRVGKTPEVGRVVENEESMNENFKKNLMACFKCGILNPVAGDISKLDHVTPDYIIQHVEAAGNGNLGLAIVRIRAKEKPRKKKPSTNVADTKKYVEGEFSEFVEH